MINILSETFSLKKHHLNHFREASDKGRASFTSVSSHRVEVTSPSLEHIVKLSSDQISAYQCCQ